MAMSGFICHDVYYDRLKRLSNEELGNLFRQLMLYHAGREDEMTDFIGNEGIAFDFIASDIDRIEEKRNEISETNRINGSKGGRPKKQKEPEKTEENRNEPTETEQNQTKAYKRKVKVNIKEKVNENINNLFARFWATYPRHDAKQTALKAFEKLNPDEELLGKMLSAIEKQKASSQWQENGGQFIPYPATWLNQHRWEDEVKDYKPEPNKLPAQDYEQRSYSGYEDEAIERMIRLAREREERAQA